MKKPDRWERAVGVHQYFTDIDIEKLDPVIHVDDAVMLLRREHQAVRKIVTDRIKGGYAMGTPDYKLALTDILAALDKRRR